MTEAESRCCTDTILYILEVDPWSSCLTQDWVVGREQSIFTLSQLGVAWSKRFSVYKYFLYVTEFHTEVCVLFAIKILTNAATTLLDLSLIHI